MGGFYEVISDYHTTFFTVPSQFTFFPKKYIPLKLWAMTMYLYKEPYLKIAASNDGQLLPVKKWAIDMHLCDLCYGMGYRIPFCIAFWVYLRLFCKGMFNNKNKGR
jgi:hypothetical protein